MNTAGLRRYQRWTHNEKGEKVIVASKRNFFQRIEKMEQMNVAALTRYHKWFKNKGLVLADLIILQRLGAIK